MKRRHFSQKVSLVGFYEFLSDAYSTLDKEFLSAETHSVPMGDNCSGASQADIEREARAIPHNPQRIPM
jgi:hypothetical protein